MSRSLTATSTPAPPAWLVDAAVVVLIVVTTVVPAARAPLPGTGPGPEPGLPQEPSVEAAMVVVAVLAAACVPLRRHLPTVSYLAATVLYLATVAVGMHALGPGIAAAVTAFAMAEATDRVTAWALGGTGAAMIAVLSVTTAGERTIEAQVVVFAAAVATATALGISARDRREYTALVAERAERAEATREQEASRRVAEERLRIAQDLHDTVAHRISVISLNAGVASSTLETSPETAREALGTIRAASREVLGDIGVLLRYLRADDGDGSGAGGGADGVAGPATARLPQPTLADLPALLDSFREAGLAVEAEIDVEPERWSPTTALVAYRVIQEGLTNAHKHGSGHRATVSLVARGGHADVVVANPVDPDHPNQPDAPSGGMGLTGLRERLGAVGGTLRVETAPGEHRLTAELPQTVEAGS